MEKLDVTIQNHLLDLIHSLDNLLSMGDKPSCSTSCQVNETSVIYIGRPIYLITYLLSGKGPKFLNDIIQFIIIESKAICIFDCIYGDDEVLVYAGRLRPKVDCIYGNQLVMENR